MVYLIDSLLDLMLGILTAISQAVETLVHCFFYPFEVLFMWVGNISKLIFDCFVGLISTFWATFDIMYLFFSDILSSFLPYAWISIILVGFTIVFLLRIYFFLKDISILGNKI